VDSNVIENTLHISLNIVNLFDVDSNKDKALISSTSNLYLYLA
jgi:hypothetical protein